MRFGFLLPRSAKRRQTADTKRAPADDGRRAATSTDAAPSSHHTESGFTSAVTDYDIIEDLSLARTLELAARRAEKRPLVTESDVELFATASSGY